MTKSIESYIRREFTTIDLIVAELETIFENHNLYSKCDKSPMRTEDEWLAIKPNECALNINFFPGIRKLRKRTHIIRLSYYDSKTDDVVQIFNLRLNNQRIVNLSFEKETYYECAVAMLTALYEFINK